MKVIRKLLSFFLCVFLAWNSLVQVKEDYLFYEISYSEMNDQYNYWNFYKEINDDFKFIVEIPSINLKEPIVQGKNNQEYLYKTINFNPTSAGVSFMDSNATLNSFNLVVFGHSSNLRGHLFTPLWQLKTDIKADTVYLHLENEIITYKIIAVLVVSEDSEIGLLSMNTEWRKFSQWESYLERLKEQSIYFNELKITDSDSFLTLITCDEILSNRVIVISKKLDG